MPSLSHLRAKLNHRLSAVLAPLLASELMAAPVSYMQTGIVVKSLMTAPVEAQVQGQSITLLSFVLLQKLRDLSTRPSDPSNPACLRTPMSRTR